MNITALYDDYNQKSGDLKHINQFVAAGLLYIIKNYFSQWATFFVLTMCCRNKIACDFYKDMFSKMFTEWQEWPLQIVVVNEEDFKYVLGIRQYNLLFIDSHKSLQETQIHTYVEESNSNEYFYILLKAADNELDGEMKKIFSYCWQHYLINCVVQVQKANGQVLIYTYYPFTPKHCGQVGDPVLINEFNGTSLVHEVLIPEKLKNLYGCPIKAALFHTPPYLYIDRKGNNATITGGIEGKLLLEMSKKLNFTIDILPPISERGEVLNNGSLTGSLLMLQNRQADLSMGSFRQTAKRSLATTGTISYYQTVWSVITLSEAYVLTSWETITFPFNAFTWCLLSFMILLLMAVVAVPEWILYKKLQHRRYISHVCLDVFLIAMGMPAQYTPTYNASRIIEMTWVMFTLIIRTIYQALLYHLICTHVRRNMPQSLEEIVEQNYSLVIDTMSLDSLEEIPLFNSINFLAIDAVGDTYTLTYLEQQPLHKAKHMAVAVPITFYKFYTDTMHKAGVFKVLPKDIMNFKLCMFLTKHSYLIEQFNDILKLFNGFGILDAWYRQEIDDDYVSSKHIVANHILGLKQLHMAFVLLLIGYFIAVMVFILELIYKRLFSHGKCLRKFRKQNRN